MIRDFIDYGSVDRTHDGRASERAVVIVAAGNERLRVFNSLEVEPVVKRHQHGSAFKAEGRLLSVAFRRGSSHAAEPRSVSVFKAGHSYSCL